ncbi:MAG: hypothetical protein HFH65_01295 [Lachnospiraceae bacterium]|nr:hypothetical protein [Lachnospiraceae bacterium]
MDEKLRLSIETVLKKKTNEILKEINYLMDEKGVGDILKNGPKDKNQNKNNKQLLGRTQFTMLMNAATEASCVEELLLFLAYQESRNSGWKIQCEKSNKSIAENIVDSLIEIQTNVYSAIEKEVETEYIDEDDERVIKLEIARKYTGYLYWKVSAICKAN